MKSASVIKTRHWAGARDPPCPDSPPKSPRTHVHAHACMRTRLRIHTCIHTHAHTRIRTLASTPAYTRSRVHSLTHRASHRGVRARPRDPGTGDGKSRGEDYRRRRSAPSEKATVSFPQASAACYRSTQTRITPGMAGQASLAPREPPAPQAPERNRLRPSQRYRPPDQVWPGRPRPPAPTQATVGLLGKTRPGTGLLTSDPLHGPLQPDWVTSHSSGP